MKAWSIGALTALVFGALVGAAHASVFDFSYFANGGPSGREFGHGSIVLSNTLTDGYFDVLSIRGVANHSEITGLSDYAGADNVIHTDEAFVDQGGVSFATKAGVDYNFFFYDGVYDVLSSTTSHNTWAIDASPLKHLCVSYVSSAVPEPSSWLLMILGIGGVGMALRQSGRGRSWRLSPA